MGSTSDAEKIKAAADDDDLNPEPKDATSTRTDLDRLKALWERATPKERREFLAWIKERRVKTDLNAESGLRTRKAS